MAQTQSAQGPSDPDANGGGMPDVPEMWGNGGMVGDGRYRLTHRLGRGGMAEVFAAEDVRLGRTVAVKLLRADLAEDPVSKARFTREAQSVAGLNHHAVVAVYDSGEDIVGRQTVPYIVMELVEGRTIRDLLLNAEAPPPEQALIIVSGVLDALAYSHQHGIVHRDIKPANVIITNNGAVKVMDFGIARALHGAASTMTQTGMVMGTPQYLSPEQALGKTVDARSDLYATGCMLYELLALRPPFTGETPLSVVYQHVQDNPVPPSQVLDSVPPELDGLVMRSLAKDPDDRFQSAEEMRSLVQYSLQMLHDAGGHTGAWDTGQVPAAAATQVLGGVGLGQTTAMQRPQHGDTSPQRILPQGMGGSGDDDYAPGGHGRGGGSSRGKLIAVIALVAAVVVAVAAYAATRGNGGKGADTEPTKKPSHSSSSSADPSKSATPKKDEKSSDPNPGTGTTGETSDENDSYSSTGGSRHKYTKPPTQEPSNDPSGDPTNKPTDDPKPGTNTGASSGNSGGTPGTSSGNNGGTPGTNAGPGGSNNPPGGTNVPGSAGDQGTNTTAGNTTP
ncbi:MULTISPECIES: protein kinase domain-containing protein [Streptomyces]|uniref:protein kinase domain-containing protein n=1 Tax=Streptomyces TaxID=1883 RepID=UPI00163D398C|nr:MULTISPECIES: protein kinase [Streptomyces]MBC2873638.1 protein kinase [Streptomyces sp. TYQ1024]UBI37928.1 protein kinase [Streptomyces mobaraensis]UKW30514.1 protein kinase [Streptomyces sp. TYQ1024]